MIPLLGTMAALPQRMMEPSLENAPKICGFGALIKEAATAEPAPPVTLQSVPDSGEEDTDSAALSDEVAEPEAAAFVQPAFVQMHPAPPLAPASLVQVVTAAVLSASGVTGAPNSETETLPSSVTSTSSGPAPLAAHMTHEKTARQTWASSTDVPLADPPSSSAVPPPALGLVQTGGQTEAEVSSSRSVSAYVQASDQPKTADNGPVEQAPFQPTARASAKAEAIRPTHPPAISPEASVPPRDAAATVSPGPNAAVQTAVTAQGTAPDAARLMRSASATLETRPMAQRPARAASAHETGNYHLPDQPALITTQDTFESTGEPQPTAETRATSESPSEGLLPVQGEAKSPEATDLLDVRADLPTPQVHTRSFSHSLNTPPDAPVPLRSPLVQAAVERITPLPSTPGATVVRLNPHGLGLIEVTIQHGQHGVLDVALRVQNPLVLHAMQQEHQAIAQAIAPQQGGPSGSLTMDLFQSGSGAGQRDAQSQPQPQSPAPATDDQSQTAPARQDAPQILRADHVNILT